MSVDLLASSKAKINRAKKHLAELKTEIGAYHGRQPYRISRDIESEPGKEIYRFEFTEAIPEEWGSLVGDVIHNLRSALDTLATALVLANGETSRSVIRSTYFPTGATKEGFEDRLPKDLAGASEAARRLVKRLKPYKGGTAAFWQLNQLDNLDKHTVLIPVGASHTQIAMIFDMSKMFAAMFPNNPPMPEGLGKPTPLFLNPAEIQYPLKNGDVIFTYGLGPDTEGKFKPDFKFTLDIAFGEGQIIDGQPVIPSLQQLTDFVGRVVGIFERRLFKTA